MSKRKQLWRRIVSTVCVVAMLASLGIIPNVASADTPTGADIPMSGYAAVGVVDTDSLRAEILLDCGTSGTVRYTGTAPTTGAVHRYTRTNDGVYTFTYLKANLGTADQMTDQGLNVRFSVPRDGITDGYVWAADGTVFEFKDRAKTPIFIRYTKYHWRLAFPNDIWEAMENDMQTQVYVFDTTSIDPTDETATYKTHYYYKMSAMMVGTIGIGSTDLESFDDPERDGGGLVTGYTDLSGINNDLHDYSGMTVTAPEGIAAVGAVNTDLMTANVLFLDGTYGLIDYVGTAPKAGGVYHYVRDSLNQYEFSLLQNAGVKRGEMYPNGVDMTDSSTVQALMMDERSHDEQRLFWFHDNASSKPEVHNYNVGYESTPLYGTLVDTENYHASLDAPVFIRYSTGEWGISNASYMFDHYNTEANWGGLDYAGVWGYALVSKQYANTVNNPLNVNEFLQGNHYQLDTLVIAQFDSNGAVKTPDLVSAFEAGVTTRVDLTDTSKIKRLHEKTLVTGYAAVVAVDSANKKATIVTPEGDSGAYGAGTTGVVTYAGTDPVAGTVYAYAFDVNGVCTFTQPTTNLGMTGADLNTNAALAYYTSSNAVDSQSGHFWYTDGVSYTHFYASLSTPVFIRWGVANWGVTTMQALANWGAATAAGTSVSFQGYVYGAMQIAPSAYDVSFLVVTLGTEYFGNAGSGNRNEVTTEYPFASRNIDGYAAVIAVDTTHKTAIIEKPYGMYGDVAGETGMVHYVADPPTPGMVHAYSLDGQGAYIFTKPQVNGGATGRLDTTGLSSFQLTTAEFGRMWSTTAGIKQFHYTADTPVFVRYNATNFALTTMSALTAAAGTAFNGYVYGTWTHFDGSQDHYDVSLLVVDTDAAIYFGSPASVQREGSTNHLPFEDAYISEGYAAIGHVEHGYAHIMKTDGTVGRVAYVQHAPTPGAIYQYKQLANNYYYFDEITSFGGYNQLTQPGDQTQFSIFPDDTSDGRFISIWYSHVQNEEKLTYSEHYLTAGVTPVFVRYSESTWGMTDPASWYRAMFNNGTAESYVFDAVLRAGPPDGANVSPDILMWYDTGMVMIGTYGPAVTDLDCFQNVPSNAKLNYFSGDLHPFEEGYCAVGMVDEYQTEAAILTAGGERRIVQYFGTKPNEGTVYYYKQNWDGSYTFTEKTANEYIPALQGQTWHPLSYTGAAFQYNQNGWIWTTTSDANSVVRNDFFATSELENVPIFVRYSAYDWAVTTIDQIQADSESNVYFFGMTPDYARWNASQPWWTVGAMMLGSYNHEGGYVTTPDPTVVGAPVARRISLPDRQMVVLKGASIRTEEDVTYQGLRYAIGMDDAWVPPHATVTDAGLTILPADLQNGVELTADPSTIYCVNPANGKNVKASVMSSAIKTPTLFEQFKETGSLYATLYDIVKGDRYTREMVSRAWVKYQIDGGYEVTVYSENSNGQTDETKIDRGHAYRSVWGVTNSMSKYLQGHGDTVYDGEGVENGVSADTVNGAVDNSTIDNVSTLINFLRNNLDILANASSNKPIEEDICVDTGYAAIGAVNVENKTANIYRGDGNGGTVSYNGAAPEVGMVYRYKLTASGVYTFNTVTTNVHNASGHDHQINTPGVDLKTGAPDISGPAEWLWDKATAHHFFPTNNDAPIFIRFSATEWRVVKITDFTCSQVTDPMLPELGDMQGYVLDAVNTGGNYYDVGAIVIGTSAVTTQANFSAQIGIDPYLYPSDMDLFGYNVTRWDLATMTLLTTGSYTTFNKFDPSTAAANNWTTALLNAADVQQNELEASYVNQGDLTRLANVIRKLQAGQTITVAALGGSITEGMTTSPINNGVDRMADYYNTAYSAQLVQWMQRRYGADKVQLCKAGIGSTGSMIANSRVIEDVFSKNPDIIIIEFAVNDHGRPDQLESYEGLVYRALTQPQQPAVILPFTTQDNDAQTLGAMGDGILNCEEELMKVGFKYDLPMISFRRAIYTGVAGGKYNFRETNSNGVSFPDANGNAIAISGDFDTTNDIIPSGYAHAGQYYYMAGGQGGIGCVHNDRIHPNYRGAAIMAALMAHRIQLVEEHLNEIGTTVSEPVAPNSRWTKVNMAHSQNFLASSNGSFVPVDLGGSTAKDNFYTNSSGNTAFGQYYDQDSLSRGWTFNAWAAQPTRTEGSVNYYAPMTFYTDSKLVSVNYQWLFANWYPPVLVNVYINDVLTMTINPYHGGTNATNTEILLLRDSTEMVKIDLEPMLDTANIVNPHNLPPVFFLQGITMSR